MKKLVLTAAILMGFVMGSFAQHSLFQNKEANSGLFYRGEDSRLEFRANGDPLNLPMHGAIL